MLPPPKSSITSPFSSQNFDSISEHPIRFSSGSHVVLSNPNHFILKNCSPAILTAFKMSSTTKMSSSSMSSVVSEVVVSESLELSSEKILWFLSRCFSLFLIQKYMWAWKWNRPRWFRILCHRPTLTRRHFRHILPKVVDPWTSLLFDLWVVVQKGIGGISTRIRSILTNSDTGSWMPANPLPGNYRFSRYRACPFFAWWRYLVSWNHQR